MAIHGRHLGGRAPLGLAFNWGTPLVSGVVVTAGGLIFTGAVDSYLRALDAKSGAELWQGRLPVPGIANPMTYLWKGEQYVVIAAGGHSEIGTRIGDSVVAFRLPRAGRGTFAMVAHHRPARRQVSRQGAGGRNRSGVVDRGAMALAPRPDESPQR